MLHILQRIQVHLLKVSLLLPGQFWRMKSMLLKVLSIASDICVTDWSLWHAQEPGFLHISLSLIPSSRAQRTYLGPKLGRKTDGIWTQDCTLISVQTCFLGRSLACPHACAEPACYKAEGGWGAWELAVVIPGNSRRLWDLFIQGPIGPFLLPSIWPGEEFKMKTWACLRDWIGWAEWLGEFLAE